MCRCLDPVPSLLLSTESVMTAPAPVDLIHLTDPDGDPCIVRVTGRFQPGALTGHDILRAGCAHLHELH